MSDKIHKLQKQAAQMLGKGKLSKALGCYIEICKIQPNDVRVWVKIGDLYRRLERLQEAIEVYTKAAKMYAVRGELPQAIGVTKVILEIDSDRTETQQLLTRLYSYRDDEEKAQAKGASSDALEELRKGQQDPISDDADDELVIESMSVDGATAGSAEEDDDEFVISHGAALEGAPTVRVGDGLAAVSEAARVEADLIDVDSVAELPDIPLFSSLPPDVFSEFVEMMEIEHYTGGAVVLWEGEAGDAFYVVAAGTAKVTRQAEDGTDVELASLGAGQFFGEMAYFSGGNRMATVVAGDELTLLVLSRTVLDAIVDRYPDVARIMQQYYRERLLNIIFSCSPLFQSLGEVDRRYLADEFEYLEARAGEILIQQGQAGEGLFILAQGTVRASSRVKDETIDYPDMLEGAIFGEISLLTDKPATATCVTATDSTLFKLPKGIFSAMIEQHPEIEALAKDIARERYDRSRKMVANRQDLTSAGMI